MPDEATLERASRSIERGFNAVGRGLAVLADEDEELLIEMVERLRRGLDFTLSDVMALDSYTASHLEDIASAIESSPDAEERFAAWGSAFAYLAARSRQDFETTTGRAFPTFQNPDPNGGN